MANNFQLRYKTEKVVSVKPTHNNIEKELSKSSKFVKFTKNVMRSGNKLTVDVIGHYLPNTKTFAENASDARKEAMEKVGVSITKAKNVYKKITGISGVSSKEPKAFLSTTIK
jgi:hypothetical protein